MPKRLNLGEQVVSPPVITPTVNNNLVQVPTPAQPSAMVVYQPLTMNEVSDFGTKAQVSLATVTDKITGIAKTSDMDEMGKLLGDVILAAKGYDPDNLFKGGFLGFFKAKANQIRMKFDTVDGTVNRLLLQIKQRIELFRGRVADLQALRENTEKFHDSLTDEIVKITKRADWMDQNVPEVIDGDMMSAQNRQDWLTVITFARKRADDLRRAQVLAEQQVVQIKLMQDNSIALAQKFRDIEVTTVPSMKQTFTLYILNMEQKKGAEFADTIDGLNDDVLKRNAALLGTNTVAIQTSLARSNISMEALKANYDAIQQSMADTDRIRKDMKARLAAEAPQLEKLSDDLRASLAQKVM